MVNVLNVKGAGLRVFLSVSDVSGKKAEVKVSCQADFAKARAAALAAAERAGWFLQLGACLAAQRPQQAAAGRSSALLLLAPAKQPRTVTEKHNLGRSTSRHAGKALLSFRYIFFSCSRNGNVCGKFAV